MNSESEKSQPSRKVVVVSGHYLQSKRKAGFHWLADAFHRRGDEVLFFTSSVSWLSRIKGHHLFAYPIIAERGRMIEKANGLWSYVWMPALHPVRAPFRFMDRLTKPLLTLFANHTFGESLEFIQQADLIIFESTPALMLFPRMKRLNPNARFVYRVSDDLAFMRNHDAVIREESQFAKAVDLVSVPFRSFLKKFPNANCVHHLHGIRKDLFDSADESPYDDQKVNAVFVGVNFLDIQFVQMAAELRPDWRFHIIGLCGDVGCDNVKWYGELPFEDTVRYLKHADIGMLCLMDMPGSSYFTDTLKTIQYCYCRLPVVAPKMLRSDRENLFFYDPGDRESIDHALTMAADADRSRFRTDGIWSWDELVEQLG